MDKALLSGSTAMLLLKLLEEQDMYGYQMIETLARRSDHTFDLKAGTLYPLLHTLEERGDIEAYLEGEGSTRPRRYYRLTDQGRQRIRDFLVEWQDVMRAYRYIAASQEGGATPLRKDETP